MTDLQPRFLALTNLDFEYELASGSEYLPPVRALGPGTRFDYILRLLPEARQAECLESGPLVDAKPIPSSWSSVERLIVWGVTPQTVSLAVLLGLHHTMPPVDLVCEVNDKRFSHRLEKDWGIALPHSRIVSSLDDFEAAVAGCPFDWVLKHPLGFSARERVVGKREMVSASGQGWARRKLAQGWTLLFEPWVEQRRDFSMHFQVESDGAVQYVGVCELVGDPGGVYRGNRVAPSVVAHDVALRYGTEVARKLAQLGYWGPVGIDAFMGKLGDLAVLRPLVEINARYSFGRLTLAMGDWIPPGWSYLWWHPSRANSVRVPSSLPRLPEIGEPAPAEGIYALPAWVDPYGNSGTAVVLAPTAPLLDSLAAALMGSNSSE